MRKVFFVSLALLLLAASARPVELKAALNGSLIKSASDSAVYYLQNGQRYAFPSEKVYFSWYADFSNVQTVSNAELAGYQLAANVTYRPGYRLVKIATDPKVYAVSRYGILHWISTEQIANGLYGSAWSANVHDVPDAFFTNYKIGTPIFAVSDFDLNSELNIVQIYQNILGASAPVVSSANISGCQVFPPSNAWNQDISALATHPNSAAYISTIGLTRTLHPDFGSNQAYGIPFNVVSGFQRKVPITYTAYGSESDPGPFPIPDDAKIESGRDAHVLVLDKDNCRLYELYAASKNTTGWSADSGAVWDLKTGALRPFGWTSADAAGLPILPGLVRYDEVAVGEIKHAIRFTASRSQNGYILPATHQAGSNNSDYPPMGLRVRLKADFDLSRLTGQARVIATAMKKYGLILADNGTDWYLSGATDPRWNDDELNQLKLIPGSAFEAVMTGEIRK